MANLKVLGLGSKAKREVRRESQLFTKKTNRFYFRYNVRYCVFKIDDFHGFGGGKNMFFERFEATNIILDAGRT